MNFKNFYKETIQVESKEKKQEELQRMYGISKEDQRIFEINGDFFLSIKNEIKEKKENIDLIKMPEELKCLGAQQEDFEYFYSQCKDLEMTKKCLFPYLFSDKKKTWIFDHFDRSNLENIKEFINEIDEKKKRMILKNVEEYINCFFKVDEESI